MKNNVASFLLLGFFWWVTASGTNLIAQTTGKHTPQSQPQNQKEMVELRKQVIAAQQEVSELKAKLQALETTVTLQGYSLAGKQNKVNEISIDPSNHNYQRLDADPGQFLVSLKDLQPYLNGYKVTLSVGNPSSASYKGAKFKCSWSKGYNWKEYSETSYKTWQSAIHTTETDVLTTLEPGAWNKVELTLLPASAEELGYFLLSMEASTLSLRTN